MNPIKKVIALGNSTQKEVANKMGIKQATLSHRMNHAVKGSLEWAIDIAKEIEVNEFTIIYGDFECKIEKL